MYLFVACRLKWLIGSRRLPVSMEAEAIGRGIPGGKQRPFVIRVKRQKEVDRWWKVWLKVCQVIPSDGARYIGTDVLREFGYSGHRALRQAAEMNGELLGQIMERMTSRAQEYGGGCFGPADGVASRVLDKIEFAVEQLGAAVDCKVQGAAVDCKVLPLPLIGGPSSSRGFELPKGGPENAAFVDFLNVRAPHFNNKDENADEPDEEPMERIKPHRLWFFKAGAIEVAATVFDDIAEFWNYRNRKPQVNHI